MTTHLDGAQLAAMIARASVGIAAIDPATERFVWANPAMCGVLGRDLDDLVQMTWIELSDPTDLMEGKRLVAELARGERDSFQLRKAFLRPDGSLATVVVTVSNYRDERGVETLRYLIARPTTEGASLAPMLRLLADAADGEAFGHALAHRLLLRHSPIYVAVHGFDVATRSLALAACFGATAAEQRGPTDIPLELALPATTVFREGSPLAASVPSLALRYPLLSRWATQDPCREVAWACVLPLHSNGLPRGVLTVVLPEPVTEMWQLRSDLDSAADLAAAWLRVNQQAVSASHRHEPLGTSAGTITPRQRQVLELVAAGRTNAQIALEVCFSEGTIRADLRALTHLLGASGRRDLVRRARLSGILDPRHALGAAG